MKEWLTCLFLLVKLELQNFSLFAVRFGIGGFDGGEAAGDAEGFDKANPATYSPEILFRLLIIRPDSWFLPPDFALSDALFNFYIPQFRFYLLINV